MGGDCSRARQFLTVREPFTTLTMTNIIGSTTRVIGLQERERAMEPQTLRMEVYTEVCMLDMVYLSKFSTPSFQFKIGSGSGRVGLGF